MKILKTIILILTISACVTAAPPESRERPDKDRPPRGMREERELFEMFGLPHETGMGKMRHMLRGRMKQLSTPLTPKQEKEALAFVREIAPWKMTYIEKRKSLDEGSYFMLLRGFLFRKHSLDYYLEKGDTARYNREMQTIKLSNQTHMLARKYRATTSEKEKRTIRGELVTALHSLFELREQRKLAQIDALRGKLSRLENVVARRRKNKKSIVDRRVKAMLGELEDVKW